MSGVPASGKTTVMRKVVKELGKGKICKTGTLVYQRHDNTKTIVLGSYAKAGFGGTDILSMGVQPTAVAMINAWASEENMDGWRILFEGDRLFNGSFIAELEKIKNLDCKWMMLEASDKAQEERHKKRGDTQSETWLKGRITKANKLKESINGITVLRNENEEDIENNVDWILKAVDLR
ncbi:hypothetical protein C4577_04190 [Candidatus Parcubacteria bacterium]|nr:MAG: hypothetical protein C4577_04190 [Candidatus Parcubacteria bacterium]